MINSTLEFLYGLHNRGIKLGLKNIESFLKVCGDPHNKIKTIHLAGTNGKGSTSSIIAKILQENGYKVGLYTCLLYTLDAADDPLRCSFRCRRIT